MCGVSLANSLGERRRSRGEGHREDEGVRTSDRPTDTGAYIGDEIKRRKFGETFFAHVSHRQDARGPSSFVRSSSVNIHAVPQKKEEYKGLYILFYLYF